MGQMRSGNENLKGHITTLKVVVLALFILLAGTLTTNSYLAKNQSISIPPDLRSGALVELNKPHPANVFAFTTYIYQTLNDWPLDGSVEYSKNIYKLQHYLSKSYMQFLLDELYAKGRRGEVEGRTRKIKLLSAYTEASVDIVSESSWVVWLDYELTEHVKGLKIKTINIRYPIKVMATDPNPDDNPWGMLLDGFAQTPFEIKELEK